MIPWSVAQICAAINGEPDLVDGAALVGAVVCDSRQVVPGSMFVAIPGERVDGHSFAAEVIAAGAVVVLAERPVGVPAIIVSNSVAALGELAAAYRRSLPEITVLALTGSSGKTTTKDLLANILEPIAATVAPQGSYNSEVGLPLTILECNADTKYLVLEMGMRGLGHIAYLCGIGAPQIGGLINVGSAHLGELGSREAIAEAKGEILAGLPSSADGGIAVVHADNPLVRAQEARTTARIVSFGESVDADVRASSVTIDELARARFELEFDGDIGSVQLQLAGEHQVANACAAAALALAAGVGFADVITGLNSAQPRSRWRMEITNRSDGVTVINDAYNANPESMRAALKALVALGQGRRTWAVLGEMGELGADSQDEHDVLGRMIVRLDVSQLIAVGSGTRALYLGANLEGSWGDEAAWVEDVDAAIEMLRANLRPGDVVLIKASRSFGLERVAHALLAQELP